MFSKEENQTHLLSDNKSQSLREPFPEYYTVAITDNTSVADRHPNH